MTKHHLQWADTPSERERPRFDRASALGWRDIALDGLNCYLRCLEAVLRWRGHSREEVTLILAGPVDLLRRESSGSQYESYSVVWRIAADARDHWDGLAATIGSGEPVIVMPDRYYWPGDEFEGVRHFHDHTVLAFALRDGILSVLDTDAPHEDGYARHIPVTESVRLACTRWAVVQARDSGPPQSITEFKRRIVEPSLGLLVSDIAELRAFGDDWRATGLDDVAARALHVAALGDFQPTLFLFAEALDGFDEATDLGDVVRAARLAARRAKSLGLVLIALHRERSDEAYELSIGAFEMFVRALEALRDELVGCVRAHPPDAVVPQGVFHRRLLDLTRYCFDAGHEASGALAAAGAEPLR